MDKENSVSISQSGESNTYTPQKVEKLEADEYLIEKAIKAQENALERMRRQKLTAMRLHRAEEHNKTVRKRKAERKNRREGRK